MPAFDASVAAPPSAVHSSLWHSPVPYLFGGLSAILGLVTFALLVLACSYWKLSAYLDSEADGGESDLEAGEKDGGDKAEAPVMEEKVLVIMAGQDKPTFLATPVSRRAGLCSENSTFSEADLEENDTENVGSLEMGNMVAHESTSADQRNIKNFG